MSPLAGESCVPCQRGGDPLSLEEAEQLLPELPGWELRKEGTRLRRRFKLKDFAQAMEFVNRVAQVAEQAQHHPDMHISWNKVTLTLYTHAIGGLHRNDFILAARIGELEG